MAFSVQNAELNVFGLISAVFGKLAANCVLKGGKLAERGEKTKPSMIEYIHMA